MAIPEDSERLTERDHQMWDDYVSRNMTQKKIADKYGVSQGLVSRRIRMVRESLPPQSREDIIARRVEQLDQIVTDAYLAALSGDSDKLSDYLKITEREAKLLGLFAAEKHQVEADTTVRYVIDLGD